MINKTGICRFYFAAVLRAAVLMRFFWRLVGISPLCTASSFLRAFKARVDKRIFTPLKRRVCRFTPCNFLVATLEWLRLLALLARFPEIEQIRDILIGVSIAKCGMIGKYRQKNIQLRTKFDY